MIRCCTGPPYHPFPQVAFIPHVNSQGGGRYEQHQRLAKGQGGSGGRGAVTRWEKGKLDCLYSFSQNDCASLLQFTPLTPNPQHSLLTTPLVRRFALASTPGLSSFLLLGLLFYNFHHFHDSSVLHHLGGDLAILI